MSKTYNVVATKFNNYYNRILKRYETLDAYIEGRSHFIQEAINFNPNDGIETTFILGKGENSDESISFHNFDYFIYYYTDSETNENTIISRWFILDSIRTRGGQVRLTLRRDVLADSYNDIVEAPVFVEKGIINDLDSPLLLNNEDVKVNQIKVSETLLKDISENAWLVLYLKKGALGNAGIGPNHNGKITIDVSQNDDFVYQTLATPIESWPYYQYRNSDYKLVNALCFKTYFAWAEQGKDYVYNIWNNQNSSCDYRATARGNLSFQKLYRIDERLDTSFQARLSTMVSQFYSAFSSYQTSNPLAVYDGKIIKDSTGKYFRVRMYVNNASPTTSTEDVTTAAASALKTTMTEAWREAAEPNAESPSYNPNDQAFQAQVNYMNIRLELTELPSYQTEIDFGAYTGKGTEDSTLFDAICVPYGSVWEQSDAWPTESWPSINTNKERSISLMSSLTTQLTSEWVLDLQLLPYCPCRSSLRGHHLIILPDAPEGTCLIGKNGDGDITDLIIVCEQSNFSFDLDVLSNLNPLVIEDNSDVPESFKRKYVNDCTFIRLCSPNYNGVFEFNLAKNGGSIKTINVDMTLRPFNPYIHANPNFNFLYGKDYNDARGLICGGDFSLGIINDAWNVYEIQNRNYQAIFDRQIQNLDINNAIARQEAGWGIAAGVISGASAGAAGGAVVGGGWGALAGGIIGAGASGVGGALDWSNLMKRQQETRNYAIDNFNLTLGNVRALPNSITKTNPVTYNNKLFIFYEIYECTEEEKQAYYMKLKYNGMTIGVIGTMSKYESVNNENYFRGKLIRLTEIVEDYHYLSIINEELMKGVFI